MFTSKFETLTHSQCNRDSSAGGTRMLCAKMSEPDRMASLNAALDLIQKCAGRAR